MRHDNSTDDHEALVIENISGNIEGEILVNALQKVLVEKAILTDPEVTNEILKLEAPGMHLGAKVIAKAWVDPEYKSRLLKNGKSAIVELGINIGEAQIIVVENTSTVHNLITCTLCSCYPRSILGQPPSWYISKAYRARSVREPREVLGEFGLRLGDEVKLYVHDSNADMRYLVLPEPPMDWKTKNLTDLEACISRDHMIGVARYCHS